MKTIWVVLVRCVYPNGSEKYVLASSTMDEEVDARMMACDLWRKKQPSAIDVQATSAIRVDD